MSPNRLLHSFDCEIHIEVADNVSERRIPAAKDRIEKLHQLRQELRLQLVEAQEWMAAYYNARHIPKQFQTGNFVKLSTKNLKLKCPKLAPHWIGPFRVLGQIRGQAYQLALPGKNARTASAYDDTDDEDDDPMGATAPRKRARRSRV